MSKPREQTSLVHPFQYFIVNDILSPIFNAMKEQKYVVANQILHQGIIFFSEEAHEELKDISNKCPAFRQNPNFHREEWYGLLESFMAYLHKHYLAQAKFEVPTRGTSLKFDHPKE